MGGSATDVTMLLRAAASGERRNIDALTTAIYGDLRRLVMSHMTCDRQDHTLQPTAVVHEAYANLVDHRNTDSKDRLRFYSAASHIIRRIIIDHARDRLADLRNGGETTICMADRDSSFPERHVNLIALDEALADLAELDGQQASIVELRFFGGCSVEEIGQLLQIGGRTVDRDWQAAKAWLLARIEDAGEPSVGIGDDR
jgi:RNA polymerase sigma-70 factor, ECF subfamily